MQESEWVLLKDYGTQFEADLDIATLSTADIPVIVRGAEVGIFGPGFAGGTSRGIHVYVPEWMLDDARDLLAIE
jgi:hypothetical protein